MRTAIAGTSFTAMFFSEIEEFSDLILEVWDLLDSEKVGEFTPTPSLTLPGVHTAQFAFESSGPYQLRWTSAESDIEHYEEVSVVEAESRLPPASPSGVGTSSFPSLDAEEGLTVKLSIYDPDLAEMGISPIAATEVYDGHYQADSAFLPQVSGLHLLVWKDDADNVLGYEARDIWMPPGWRILVAGFRDANLIPYEGLHVTVTRDDGDVIRTAVTGPDGGIAVLLQEATYAITVRDPAHPYRVFDRNNFLFEVMDPTERALGNTVAYTLTWQDVQAIVLPGIPLELQSVMSVRLLDGPEGTPSMYRRFSVKLLVPVRLTDDGLVVAPHTKTYTLDSNGSAELPLIRGSEVQVWFHDISLNVKFTVPDEEKFNLADIPGSDPFGILVVSPSSPIRLI